MKLSQLLMNKAILLDIKDTNKWDLISKLTDILVETKQISAEVREPIHQALVTREKSMSTGMENGIAIPHCCVDLISETVVSLGISREGIDFDSIDNKPTHLIILLVTPKNKTKMHIETLAEIAKLLNHEASKKLLLEAGDSKEILEIIQEEEKKDYMA
ncbi:MAG: PTS sugar transporter subunit IIA [Planctomycetota bacterium]|jgi:mannitol/fructose-specific phosphotransferase system IIA component (Ntr-type)